jgi:hypothetical protein
LPCSCSCSWFAPALALLLCFAPCLALHLALLCPLPYIRRSPGEAPVVVDHGEPIDSPLYIDTVDWLICGVGLYSPFCSLRSRRKARSENDAIAVEDDAIASVRGNAVASVVYDTFAIPLWHVRKAEERYGKTLPTVHAALCMGGHRAFGNCRNRV